MEVVTLNIKSEFPPADVAVANLLIEIERLAKTEVGAIKVIHGYGSHGVGGAIKKGVHSALRLLKHNKKIVDYIPGEMFGAFAKENEYITKNFPQLVLDSDLQNYNSGITIVFLKWKSFAFMVFLWYTCKVIIFLKEIFMFSKRADGVVVKGGDPIVKLTSHIMPYRYDAMVQFLLETRCEEMDRYIHVMSEKGIKFSYMHIIMAAIVRMYAERPQLNRFVINGRLFQRDAIYISFTVKKQLIEDAGETTVKLKFTGEENIFEIKKMIDDAVLENKGDDKSNDTDGMAKVLNKMPNGLIKFVVKCFKYLDKHNCLPRKIIDISPFHTSCFLTNMKSISTDYVYHHLYDFGTTGLFVGLGKEHMKPVVDEQTNTIVPGKVIKIGTVIDERICDGFYYAKSIKLIRRFIQNPTLLEENYVIPEEQKVYTKKQLKAKKKEEKKLLKEQKKLAKLSA